MPNKSYRAGTARVLVAPTDADAATLAAEHFARTAQAVLKKKPDCNAVFAGAESQMPFHAALRARTDIAWSKINAFSVDDFYAPEIPAHCSVAAQPLRDLYPHVKPKSVHVLNYAAPDPHAECRRYAALLRTHPTDIACVGIGMSGHIALNEPGAAHFVDSELVRVVDVPEISQKQLMTDPNFKVLGVIPKRGMTMTLPAIMAAPVILVNIPYRLKAEILRVFMTCPIAEAIPCSILKSHPNTTLYADAESFSLCRDLNLPSS